MRRRYLKVTLKAERFLGLPSPAAPDIEEFMAHSGWLQRNEAADEYYGRMI